MKDTDIDTIPWNETVGQLHQNLAQPDTQRLIYELFKITHPKWCPSETSRAILINQPYKIIYPTYTNGQQGPDKTIPYNLGVLIPNPRKRRHDGEDMIGITQEDLDSIDNQDLPKPAFTATVDGRTLLFYTYSEATFNQAVSLMAENHPLKVYDFILFSPENMLYYVANAINDSQKSISDVEELPNIIEEINEAALDAMGLLEQLRTKIPSTLTL